MNEVTKSIRQPCRTSFAPELRQHRAELVAIQVELNAKIEAVDSRLDSKIDVVETRLDGKIEVLKSEVRSGFSTLGAALENAVLRGEISTTREIATSVSGLRDWKKNAVSCLNS